MPDLAVDGLMFSFPPEWKVSKYDEWKFYKNQWAKARDGIKAVDLLAADGQGTGFLIEVKDYRVHSRTKPSDLGEEMQLKVLDTLAALLPAALYANDQDEQDMARGVIGAKKLRVILHLEQPLKHSKLRPRAIDPAALQQQLKRLLRPVDAHPAVVESVRMGSLPWNVM